MDRSVVTLGRFPSSTPAHFFVFPYSHQSVGNKVPSLLRGYCGNVNP